MIKRRALTGPEVDAYGRWRHIHNWGAGEIRRIKRRTHKRERREGASEIQDQWDDQEDPS